MPVSAAQLVADVSVTGAASAIADLLRTGMAADTVGESFKAISGGALLLAGAAIVGIGVKATKMAGDWQESMTTLITGAGESKANIDLVSNGLLNMAVTTGESTDQLAKGMFTIESAGNRGAIGLAVMQSAAEGAKVGNADLGDTSMALISVLSNYYPAATSAAQATRQSAEAMNFLTAIVQNGTTNLAALAPVMSSVLPAAKAYGVRMVDVGAAMATMTGETVPAANAATYLRQMIGSLAAPAAAGAKSLKAIGLTVQEVSTDMKKSLPDTLKLIMTHLAETYKVGSPAYMTALKNIAGGAKQMQGMLDLTGSHLKTFGDNVGAVSGVITKGGAAIVGWSDVQGDFNFKMSQAKEVIETLMIKIGTALLPVVTNLLGAIIPVITAFSNWITAGSGLSTMFQQFAPYLKMIGEDFQTLGQNTLTYFMPVFQQIGSLFAPLIENFGKLGGVFKSFDFGQVGNAFQNVDGAVQSFAQIIGQVISSLKGPATEAFSSISQTISGVFSGHMKMASGLVQELGKWFQTTLLPAMKQAMPGFQSLAGVLIGTVVPGLVKLWAIGQQVIDKVLPPLVHVMEAVIPVAIKLGGIIAGGLAAALKFLMPYILQAATEIGKFAGEIATRIAPILVNFFKNISSWLDTFMKVWKTVWPYLAPILKGVFDEIVGIVKIAWSLVSGIIKIGLDLLSGNWGQAWSDLKSMLSGVWDGIKTVIQGGIELVLGDIHAFVAGIVGFFQWLWDELTGHSIIPDMVKSIITWFTNLVSGAIGWIQNMVTIIRERILMFTMAVIVTVQSWVESILKWFENLHSLAISKFHEIVTDITNILNNFVSGATSFGANLLKNIASGITGAIGDVTGAIGNVTKAIGNFLPHSPAKEGELQHLNEYGPTIGKALTKGLQDQIPSVKAAMQVMVQPMQAVRSSGSPTLAFPSMQQNPMTQVANTLAQGQGTPIILQINGQQYARVVLPYIVNGIRNTTGVRGY